MDSENLPENIPKFRQWISEKSWSHWQQFLEHNLETMTTVSQHTTNVEWYLDVLKAASARRVHATADERHGESNGTALEEMLNEELLTPMVHANNEQQYLLVLNALYMWFSYSYSIDWYRTVS